MSSDINGKFMCIHSLGTDNLLDLWFTKGINYNVVDGMIKNNNGVEEVFGGYMQKYFKEIDQNDHLIKSEKDMVNHPDHYKGKNGMEVIDIIEAYELNFAIGSAVKYLLRAGKKDSIVQEYKKAIWFIQREIDNHENK